MYIIVSTSVSRPHQNYHNKDDYNSNELEELRRKQQTTETNSTRPNPINYQFKLV